MAKKQMSENADGTQEVSLNSNDLVGIRGKVLRSEQEQFDNIAEDNEVERGLLLSMALDLLFNAWLAGNLRETYLKIKATRVKDDNKF